MKWFKLTDDRLLYFLSKDDTYYIFKYNGSKGFSGKVLRSDNDHRIVYSIETDKGFITNNKTLYELEVYLSEDQLPKYKPVDISKIYLSAEILKLYIIKDKSKNGSKIMYMTDTDILMKRREFIGSGYSLLEMEIVIDD